MRAVSGTMVIGLAWLVMLACGGNEECPDGVFEGDITVTNAEDLGRLSGCTAVTGQVDIVDTALTNLDELRSLTTAGGLGISGNDALENLDGLGNLARVEGNLEIGIVVAFCAVDIANSELACLGNAAIRNLDGLGNLEAVGGRLEIAANPALQNLNGLGKLIDLGRELYVARNGNLPTCEAESLRDRLFPGGYSETDVFICENLEDECGSDACPLKPCP